jgi:hypothetical protein
MVAAYFEIEDFFIPNLKWCHLKKKEIVRSHLGFNRSLGYWIKQMSNWRVIGV